MLELDKSKVPDPFVSHYHLFYQLINNIMSIIYGLLIGVAVYIGMKFFFKLYPKISRQS